MGAWEKKGYKSTEGKKRGREKQDSQREKEKTNYTTLCKTVQSKSTKRQKSTKKGGRKWGM